MSLNDIRVEEKKDLDGKGDRSERSLGVSSQYDYEPFAKRKHLIIAISGIYTNADWVDRVTHIPERFLTSDVKFAKVKTDLLTLPRLISRLGLAQARNDIRNQIFNIVIDHMRSDPKVPISLICHSLGTDLVADIILDIDFHFDRIFLLGSICSTKKARALRSKCNRLYIDLASRDNHSILAGLLPWCYEPSGVFGFHPQVAIEYSFKNDHDSCAESDHVHNCILPRLNDRYILPADRLEKTPYTFVSFKRARLALWVLVGLGIATFVYAICASSYLLGLGAVLFFASAISIPAYYWLYKISDAAALPSMSSLNDSRAAPAVEPN